MRSLSDIINKEYVIFYGIGNQSREFYKLVKNKQLKILCTDGDKKKWGTICFDKIVVEAPNVIFNRIKNFDYSVVITSVRNQYEIASLLVEQYSIAPDRLFTFSSNWYEENIYKIETLIEHKQKIFEIAEHLGDVESRDYYLNRYRALIDRNPLLIVPNLKSVSIGEYNGIISINKKDKIVDCGAYNGDTVSYYMEKTEGECNIYAIEPFADSYFDLIRMVDENGWGNAVCTYNLAVGNKTQDKYIIFDDSDFGMAMSLSKENGQKKQVVHVDKLDRILSGKEISYLKMDIEGEEANAIQGAKQIISKYHPKLMISAYHRAEDFWTIPEMIWSIDPAYKIYVGHAPGVSLEMEYYCK